MMMKQNHIRTISKQRHPAEAGIACIKTGNLLVDLKCKKSLPK